MPARALLPLLILSLQLSLEAALKMPKNELKAKTKPSYNSAVISNSLLTGWWF